MKKIALTTCTIFVLFFMNGIAIAQNNLNGRWSVGFNLGVFTGLKSSNVAVQGMSTEITVTGFAGNLFFSRWLRENLSLEMSAGLLTGSAKVYSSAFNNTQQTSAVFPILLGLNYYIPELQPQNEIRPYISAAIGMYIGAEATNDMISQQVHTETAIGGRIGAGVNFLLSDHFMLGANAGYHLMNNFKNPVAGKNNFNGGNFSFHVDYIF